MEKSHDYIIVYMNKSHDYNIVHMTSHMTTLCYLSTAGSLKRIKVCDNISTNIYITIHYYIII